MICGRCDQLIIGDAVRLDRSDSMSGARPDAWAHPADAPDCRAPRLAPGYGSPLRRALRRG